MANLLSSRPWPDCLKPPKGARGLNAPPLTSTCPLRVRRAAPLAPPDARALCLRDEGAEAGVGVEGVAGRIGLGRLHGYLFGLGQTRARHQHPGEGAARLARVEEGLAHAVCDGLLEVGVVEDDVGR